MDSLKNVDYSNFDVYLVDNCSKANSINAIKNYLQKDSFFKHDTVPKDVLSDYKKSDDINLLFILNDKNAGFAGGNNVALDYISKNKTTDYVLLLNNDTVVSSDFINGLLNEAQKSSNVGFIGINHYYYHDRTKLQTVGGGVVDLVHGEASAIVDNSIADFDFITGSCIFIPIEVLLDVGPMNEDFFMYWEDVDWSSLARECGYKLRISNAGCIYHKEGASIKSVRRIYYHTRNRIYYMSRHTAGLNYYKFIIYIILYVLKESVTNLFTNREYSISLLKGLCAGLSKVLI